LFGPKSPTENPIRSDFNHMKNLRDKHISHDENDWMRGVPVTIIDDPDGQPKVISVHGMVVRGNASLGATGLCCPR
jgi:hypothetical protein